MKKLFFFKSSASSSGKDNAVPPSSTNKQTTDSQSCDRATGLRRSRSLSSAAFLGTELGQVRLSDQNKPSRFKDQSRSPSSSIANDSHLQFEHSSYCRTLTPERQRKYKATQFEVSSIQNAYGIERPGSSSSSTSHHDSSEDSSICSSNISSKIVDRYIDGEQQAEKSRSMNNSRRNHFRNGNYMKLPPKIQHTAPNSPARSGAKDKTRAHSFRETKGTNYRFSSRDFTENGFGHESPRSLAKNVIERLSQSCAISKTSSKDYDNPITIEDIYARSLNGHCESDLDESVMKSYSLGDPYGVTNGYQGMDSMRTQRQDVFQGAHSEGFGYDEPEENMDVQLKRRSKEAEERVILLSEDFKQESFVPDGVHDVSDLVHIIRNLAEDKIRLALEVSGLLRSQIAERESAREELRCVKAELELQMRRLEKEKNEVQSGLEKELDRRSSDWSFKLEKYQLEEQRLRERVRELAEQNVSLQREVSSFGEREAENKNLIACTDQQLKELTETLKAMREENQALQQSLLQVQEKYKIADESRDCIQKNYEEKERECKDLHKSMTRLLRTCSEQEKTITGLREEYSEDFQKNQSVERVDKHITKLRMEQMRLTGVELALRRELESSRMEIESLRHENIDLLNRFKGDCKENVAATYRLDKELWARICCLQNQGLTMLNESTLLCSKLLEFIKEKAGHHRQDTRQDVEVIKNGLDGQFIIESDIKIQGLKSGIHSLTRSLQMMSVLSHEKSSKWTSFQSQGIDAEKSAKLSDQLSENIARTELKAETLITSLLREKLYSKELEVEQLQAELATAARGNDILRSEVRHALDELSCVTHKLKDLELQMLKKDESINNLQSELQESMKQLSIIRGIMPKVTEERDHMWEKVKQYSEQNMLLNSQVNVLKKKIDALDEDILLKEGQITILKDSLGKKPFDLLGSPDTMHEFLLN
ncbi:hypothetical protein L6164_005587 [Bauhinia variegata]|uniref:Uncharacterized protein n=1 Tax=Bauhinia variegata TaxID=167791 RepID=A0ACB9PQT4_BAUVA|nr:hypothetical protein L6164_005587 [Bauhinia variegata]